MEIEYYKGNILERFENRFKTLGVVLQIVATSDFILFRCYSFI
jgi:hypothetical protein